MLCENGDMDNFLAGFADELTKTASIAKLIFGSAKKEAKRAGKGLTDAERRSWLRAGSTKTQGLTDAERRAWLAPHLTKKGAEAKPPPDLRRYSPALRRYLAGSGVFAGLDQLAGSGRSVGESIGRGMALAGGGRVGSYAGKKLGLGRDGRTVAGLVGLGLTARALSSGSRKKEKERREKEQNRLLGQMRD